MPPPLEFRFEPNFYNLQSQIERDHALAEGDHIRVVVLAGKTRRLRVPAERAANTTHLVRADGFAIAGAPKNDAPGDVPARNRFGCRSDKQRVIDGVRAVGAEIHGIMSHINKEFFDGFLVGVPCVIGGNSDAHNPSVHGRDMGIKKARNSGYSCLLFPRNTRSLTVEEPRNQNAMSQILKNLLSEHGDELIASLASSLNVEKNQAEDIVHKGVPVVLSGLRQQKNRHEQGPDLLAQLGAALGSGAVLNQLGALFGGGSGSGVASLQSGLLEQFLGGATEKMATAIATKTGLSKPMVQKALVMLIPIVIAALFKYGQQAQAAQPIEDRDRQMRNAAQGNDPLGGLGAILDRDGDGSILDDILEMAGGGGGQEQQSVPAPEPEPTRRAGGKPRIRAASSEQASETSGGLLGGILRSIFGGGGKN